MLDKRTAAREALEAHDALMAAHNSEPDRDEEGMPRDPDAWLRWKSEISDPAYTWWGMAMDNLAKALGTPEMSRHPFNFRPICEEILSDAR